MSDDEKRVLEDEDSQRRQRALRSLAQETTISTRPTTAPADQATRSSLTTAVTTRAPASRRRWWIAALLLALGIVALGSLGYFALLRPTPTTTITRLPISVTVMQQALTCIKDMAVSPDGASVAILGYNHFCPTEEFDAYGYQPGQVNIYAVNTGQLIATVHPDDPIASALHPQVPPGVHPANSRADVSHAIINYLNMLWSPDGAQIVLTFSIQTYATATHTDNNPTAITDGVLLTDIKTAHPRVLAHTRNPQTNPSGEWNVTTGAYIPIPTGVDQSRWTPAPPALNYTWDASHTLIPEGPVLTTTAATASPPAPAIGPIGNPLGGHSFTIWQPAAIQAITTSQGDPVPGLFWYTTDFPIWSPDGSQLVTEMRLNGVLAFAGHAPLTSVTPPIGSHTPLMPIRDQGLTAALTGHARSAHVDSGAIAVTVAWRPDGRVLAVPIPPMSTPGTVGLASAGVQLYDCATGKLLATLHQPASPNNQGDPLLLRWTPDGSHLLLLDAQTGMITFWGPDQLPRA